MQTTKRRLEDRLVSFLREHADPRTWEGLMVALSGGCDSTALLELVLATRDRHQRPVFVGHVNHGVRRDADTEEERLRAICEKRGVPFLSEKLDLAGSSPADRPIGEAEMRRARYASLRSLAWRTQPRSWVLLGHQQDDQAETVLLHLVRGTGLAGLAGMRERRGRFLRPLLTVPRADLERYLAELGIAWTEDPTNRDLDRARNRIRHQVLPLLERDVRPRCGAAIARASEHLRTILDHLHEEAGKCIASCLLDSPGGGVVLDARKLHRHHRAVVEESLRQGVRMVRGSLTGIPASIWTGISRSPDRHGCRSFDTGKGTIVEISPRFIRIARGPAVEIETVETDLPWTGRTPVPPLGVLASRLRHLSNPLVGKKIPGLDRLQVFDADLLRPPFTLRLPRDGDRVQVFETSGSRKVVDLLSERGVPRPLRRSQPVLEDAAGILWLPGIRRASRALLTRETERIWMVRWFGGLPVDSAPGIGQPRQGQGKKA